MPNNVTFWLLYCCYYRQQLPKIVNYWQPDTKILLFKLKNMTTSI